MIDFAASFAEDGEDTNGNGQIDTGFEIFTNASKTESVVLDYDGNQRIGVALDNVTIDIADFIHLEGSFAFEKGPTHTVTIGTGFPANLAPLASLIDPVIESILGAGGMTISDDKSAISGIEVDSYRFETNQDCRFQI